MTFAYTVQKTAPPASKVAPDADSEDTSPLLTTSARAGVFDLPHGPLRTPVFMPVATQGAMKGVSVEMLDELDLDIILGNTYHLGLLPGADTLRSVGGLHRLEGWRRNFLTDSGGFQLVSLVALSTVTETGVTIGSTHGKGVLTLKPEDSVGIQQAIGSDIIMQLDDVVSTLTVGPRVQESMERSIRWLGRCLAQNGEAPPPPPSSSSGLSDTATDNDATVATTTTKKQTQCVFGIIQGALDFKLRRACVAAMVQQGCKGYAIGGLSGGEKKDDFWRVVRLCAALLPPNKPRYCMGVGHPVDILVCIALGVDMFDCVYPCRTARFGTALTSTGNLNLRSKVFALDPRPLDEECDCRTCGWWRGPHRPADTTAATEGGVEPIGTAGPRREEPPLQGKFTRAYLHTLAGKPSLGATLLSIHNIAFLTNLTRRAREAILAGTFDAFVLAFLHRHFYLLPDAAASERSVGAPGAAGDRKRPREAATCGDGGCGASSDSKEDGKRRGDADGPSRRVPRWVVEALASVNINVPNWDV